MKQHNKSNFKVLLIVAISVLTLSLNAQNILKSKLKGGSYTPTYSPSDYDFLNAKEKIVKLNPIVDNRSANWNKQVNDSVRIEPIKDFWNKKYKEIVFDKITKDLTIAGIDTKASLSNQVYDITCKVDAQYPEYVVVPDPGYYVLTRILVDVKQDNKEVFKKVYQDYSYFHKGISGYDSKYDKDYLAGADMAMGISMKKVLDLFYDDLDKSFDGQKVESTKGTLELESITSNIAKDENLNDDKKPFSEVKDNKAVQNTDLTANNYKITEPSIDTPKADPKLEAALSTLGVDKAEEARRKEEELAKKAEEEKRKKELALKLAAEKQKALALKQEEEAKKRQIDSIASAKKAEEAKLAAAKKAAEEKEAQLLQAKKDSIKAANEQALALKVREQKVADSLKKVEVNKELEIAKKKEAEKRKQLEAKKKKEELLKEKLADMKKKKEEELAKKKELAQAKEKSVKKSPSSFAKKPSSGGNSIDNGDESIAAAMRRIAREVEAEENGKPISEAKKELIEKNNAPKNTNEVIENFKGKKAPEVVVAKVEEEKPVVTNPIDPKKYIQDSIDFMVQLEKKRMAIEKAQKAAEEAEKRDLIVNPNAGAMFAMASTDPPSKLPDNRTREEKLRDRVFAPKNEVSKVLLNRVKLIKPEEEMKLLAEMQSPSVNSVDSVFIQYQKSRPPMPVEELKELKSDVKKEEIINKKLEETTTEKEEIKGEEKVIEEEEKKVEEKEATKEDLEQKIKEKKEEILKKMEAVKKDEKSDSKPEVSSPKKEVVKAAKDAASTEVKAEKTAEEKEKDLKDAIEKKKAEILKKIEAAKKAKE